MTTKQYELELFLFLRFCLTLCVPHQCHCGTSVDVRGLQGFVCKRAPDRIATHHALNDLVARGVAIPGILVLNEPLGLRRSDGKPPSLIL